MKKYVRQKLFFILLMIFITNSVSFAADVNFEYKLKALYITRLANFINWPDSANKNTFIICIDPTDKVAIELNKIDLETILDKPLKIIPSPTNSSINQCDVLYFSKGKADPSLINMPVLTIASHSDFAKQGGMIEFYVEKSKVRMKANLSAVNKAGIRLSSKLIRLLKIVGQQND